MSIQNLTSRSVYSMNVEELNTLLSHYENHEEGYKYDLKINSIKRNIKKLSEKESKEEPWVALARESKAITEKWESCGAYFKSKEIYCKWYYKDEEFYMWWSGVDVTQEIHRLREADLILSEIIAKEEEQS